MKIDKTRSNTEAPLPASLVLVEVQYLWRKGHHFVESCKQLDSLHSKVALSTLAIEVLVKAYIGAEICHQEVTKEEEYIRNRIDKVLRGINHDFKKLFDCTPGLFREMGIKDIERENSSGFVDEFRFILEQGGNPLIFKTLEATRYGSFLKKKGEKDVLIIADRSSEDLFLEKLSTVSFEKIRATFEYMDNIKNKNMGV